MHCMPCQDSVDAVITVSEEEILRAMKLVWERMKLIIEPSAGVGVSVMHHVLNNKYNVHPPRVHVLPSIESSIRWYTDLVYLMRLRDMSCRLQQH